MTRRLALWSVLLLLASALSTGPADARGRGGFGGFGGGRTFSRPSFPSSPFSSRPSVRPPTTFSPPRVSAPPPVITPSTPPSLPSAGGFGSGRARGVAGAPNAPPVPPTVPSTGAFGGGEARGVMGANARKPISSAPPVTPPPGSPRGTLSSSPPQPSPGNVYTDFRRVEPVRGSRNVYVYDHRPSWGFIPFWWYPPIYTPTGMLVSPGGANPLGILLTLAGVVAIVAVAVTLFRNR